MSLLRAVSVQRDNSGTTLISFLKKNFRPPLSSVSHIELCLEKEWIRVNGEAQASPTWRLHVGDMVSLVATHLDLDIARFSSPLMTVLLVRVPHFVVLNKPAGMPLRGHQPDTVESSLASSLSAIPLSSELIARAEHVLCVGRSNTGPLFVALSSGVGSKLRSFENADLIRYRFRVIVHGTPPAVLGRLAGFVSLECVSTTHSTGGLLSSADIWMSKMGRGLRRALHDYGTPVLGGGALSRASKGSSANGTYMACTCVSFPDPTVEKSKVGEADRIVVDIPLSEKFEKLLAREERFFKAKVDLQTTRKATSLRMREEFKRICLRAGVQRRLSEDASLSAEEPSFVEFSGMPFYTTKAVMTPRRSSEVLVESACDWLASWDSERLAVSGARSKSARGEGMHADVEWARGKLTSPATGAFGDASAVKVLDLGVGSGALLVALLRRCAARCALGVGLDISPDALDVARVNVNAHGFESKTQLVLGDFGDLRCLDPRTGSFNVIICNPPYLTEAEVRGEHDDLQGPPEALVSGDAAIAEYPDEKGRGMAAYHAVARALGACPGVLHPSGIVVVEVGVKREINVVTSLFESLAPVTLDSVRRDASGFARCVVLRSRRAKA